MPSVITVLLKTACLKILKKEEYKNVSFEYSRLRKDKFVS